jgi:hypothetical protein
MVLLVPVNNAALGSTAANVRYNARFAAKFHFAATAVRAASMEKKEGVADEVDYA